MKVALENGDGKRLANYGRFLDAIGNHLLTTVPASERPEIVKRLQAARAQWMKTWVAPSACSAGPL